MKKRIWLPFCYRCMSIAAVSAFESHCAYMCVLMDEWMYWRLQYIRAVFIISQFSTTS